MQAKMYLVGLDSRNATCSFCIRRLCLCSELCSSCLRLKWGCDLEQKKSVTTTTKVLSNEL